MPDPASGPVPNLTLLSPLTQVQGVGLRRAEMLATLGITSLGRLVAHLPTRHERHEEERPIAELTPGQIVSTRAEVTATRVIDRRPRPRFEAVLHDGTGRLDVVWFNQTFLAQRIHPGHHLRVQGTLRRVGNKLQLANPRWEIIPESGGPAPREARLRPIYPASEQVKSWEIEAAVRAVLPSALPLIEDHFPEAFRRERALPALAEAYRMMHEPKDEDEVRAARRRLAYDELLFLQLAVFMKRRQLRSESRAPALKWTEAIDRHIRQRFPFTLTPGQEEALAEVVRYLTSETPANRLIQGDVGSGKTVIALYAMLLAVAGGRQAALMAPTELLAEQHFGLITASLEGSRVRVELLTGSMPRAERESALARIASGDADLLVGTHALLTESVRFRSLALAVIDEQHRFGVHQRAMLRQKGADGDTTPHVLVMTATPIPRTLAITLFGDLDVSTIRGLPPGRRPVTTRVVAPEKRREVYEFVRRRIETGGQAYIVVPTIGDEPGGVGEGEIADVRSVLRELEAGPLAGMRLAALHGRLKRSTRDHVMARFRAGLVHALVATTVIEVGVDVPNASVMVVEHADRFGLAQLHQLRGRVGRGSRRSVCILIADGSTPESQQRLRVLAETNDGFVLAERDLEIRGPGEVFGARQSGAAALRVADLMRDRDLLTLARRDARDWIDRSPRLDRLDESILRRRVLKAHGAEFGLGDVG
ncbi:MAG TPA: ATP-dependent DNA helicase RecG [Phycisphaerales bacterium]|nr:ATP-dependent DNA helicase RecG [Phycisphaerales bacterium]